MATKTTEPAVQTGPPTVRFVASPSPHGAWLRTDADGESVVTLAVPGSELAEVIKLHRYQGRTFVVTVAPA